MRNIHKIVCGMMAAGVLLTGIGCGVAFAEYSTFEYSGRQVLPGSEYFSKTIDYQVKKTKEENHVVNLYLYDAYSVVEDTTVPKDEIEIEVFYRTDDKEITPELSKLHHQGETISLDTGLYYDEFHNFFRVKDTVLEGLKNHQIGEYMPDCVEKVEIRVHPEAEFDLKIK